MAQDISSPTAASSQAGISLPTSAALQTSTPFPTSTAFANLYTITQTLTDPKTGCPWDREMTPLSMRPFLIEETFEAIDAISKEDATHAKEELGDVIFNALLTARLYEMNNQFTVADVLNEISQKLIRRHPHVFGNASEGSSQVTVEADTTARVESQWERIKQNVEGRKEKHVLDSVPEGYPPLLKSLKYLKKAAKTGFDWATVEEVKQKLEEEYAEVQEAQAALEQLQAPETTPLSKTQSNPQLDEAQLHLEEELGDLLLCTVNLCRKMNVDPNAALQRANGKFYRRFNYVEENLAKTNVPPQEKLARMEQLWNEAKKEGL